MIKKTDYKHIIKSVIVVTLYVFVLRSLGISYSLDILSELNFRDIFSKGTELLTFSLLFNASVVIYTINLVDRLVIGIYNEIYQNTQNRFELLNNDIKVQIISNFREDELDVSNPFLYSNKTLGLLE